MVKRPQRSQELNVPLVVTPPSKAGSSSVANAARRVVFVVGIMAIVKLTFLEVLQGTNNNETVKKSVSSSSVQSKQQQKDCPPTPPVPVMANRYELPSVLESMNFTTGIEIGVQTGWYSAMMLRGWPSCKNYKLVDLWAQQENYKDAANVDNTQQEKYYETTKEALKQWEGITEYYRMYSNEAAKVIAAKEDSEKLVDFVYVDARHDYCGCKEDMELYWPLVKPGGIMAGHDFMSAEEVPGQDWSVCMDGSLHKEAVKGAVIEFANKHGLQLGLTYKEPAFHTWWIRKPFC